MPEKYLFVVNPISGDINKNQLFELIHDFASEHRVDVDILKTNGDDDIANILSKIELFQPTIVVAAGGDGTVNLVAKCIEGKTLILGILPMGSGNGLAKDLNIPQNDIKAALAILHPYKTLKMDTLAVNDKFFVHLCDIGFNAHIVKLFSQGKSRGLLSYMKYTVQEFMSYKTDKYEITTDNGNFRGNAFMVTVANTNRYGSNLFINPEGKCDDGKFEIIIIKRFPRKKTIGLFLKLLFRRVQFFPYCRIISCSKATIISKRDKVFQFDGEIADKIRKADFMIKPAHLPVIVPAEEKSFWQRNTNN